MKAFLKKILLRLENRAFARIFSAACILLSICALSWSFAIRLPQIERARQERSKLFALQSQIQETQASVNRATRELGQEKEHLAKQLFSSEAEARRTIAQLVESISDRFEVRLDWKDISSVPALIAETCDARSLVIHIGLAPNPAEDFSGYDRMIAFLKVLGESKQRIDIVGVNASGGPEGLARGSIELRLWLRKES